MYQEGRNHRIGHIDAFPAHLQESERVTLNVLQGLALQYPRAFNLIELIVAGYLGSDRLGVNHFGANAVI